MPDDNHITDFVRQSSLGLRHFLRFALDAGAIAQSEAEILWETAWHALIKAAQAQGQQQAASDPAKRFLELLSAATAGGSAHVANATGTAPEEAEAWGWWSEPGQVERRPMGARVGWLDGGDLYLNPDISFATVQKLARDQGDSLPVTPRTLHKRLKAAGYLASTGTEVGRETLLVRKSIEGVRRFVLHLSKNIILEALSPHKKPAQPAQSDNGLPKYVNGQVSSVPWAGFFSEPAQESTQGK